MLSPSCCTPAKGSAAAGCLQMACQAVPNGRFTCAAYAGVWGFQKTSRAGFRGWGCSTAPVRGCGIFMCGLGFLVRIFFFFFPPVVVEYNSTALCRKEVSSRVWLHTSGLDSQEMPSHSCVTPTPPTTAEQAPSVHSEGLTFKQPAVHFSAVIPLHVRDAALRAGQHPARSARRWGQHPQCTHMARDTLGAFVTHVSMPGAPRQAV